jgi:hypothetical protein
LALQTIVLLERAGGVSAIVAGADEADGVEWPCRPYLPLNPPSGKDWLHEIKHDGLQALRG